MRNLLTSLAVVVAMITSNMSAALAAPTSRTTAQWATLCRGAHKTDSLGTIPLLRTQFRALSTSLKAAGYPAGWHQDLASVLVDHGDGTCGYDNRLALQLSPKDPEADLNENDTVDIEDPFPDGALFTDPGIKVPTGFVWSAKFASAGAALYLPPIAETPTKVAAERDKFIALAEKLCTDSGRVWNTVRKECASEVKLAMATIPAHELVNAPPVQKPIVTGTISTKDMALMAATTISLLLAGLMLWLWWKMRYERDNVLFNRIAAEELCVELTRQRDEAQRKMLNTTARSLEESQAHQEAMDRLIAQALADANGHNAEIARLRKVAQVSIEAHTAAMTEVATARDEARAKITTLTAELEGVRTALQTANDELTASRAALHTAGEELAQTQQHAKNTADALRTECNRLRERTEHFEKIARDQAQTLEMLHRLGTLAQAMKPNLSGAEYFVRVKCPRPGKGDRAGKTPRDKAHAQLTAMTAALRDLFPVHPENDRHAAVSTQAPATA